jgi:transcriptional regulator with XRE-family HTH domain
VPYRDVFSEPYPDPQVPHREPPEAQPTVATPKLVRRWFDAEVAAGRINLVARLPTPEARRSLRETVGLSLQQAAELAGVTSEAVRLWEAGAREPQGENRDRYVELLGAWERASRQAGGKAELPVDGEPAEPANVDSLAAAEAARDDYETERAVAYANHRTRMQTRYRR